MFNKIKNWFKDKNNIRLCIIFIIAFIAVEIIKYNFFFIALINGQSMENNLHSGDIGIVQVQNYSYKYGDIIVAVIKDDFRQGKISVIKRVIGTPGDRIEIKDNKVYLNGEKLNESYIKEDMITDDSSWKLGKDEYFVMGDNRNNSYDSRIHGPIKLNEIKGKLISNISLRSLII